MKMEKRYVILLIYLVYFPSCFCLEEPTCSKYHFEKKVLEKVVRFEHKLEITTKSMSDISGRVKDDMATMKAELETHGSEHRNAFNKLSDELKKQMTELTKNISTELKTIKNDFEQLKHDVLDEHETRLNRTIQEEISSLRSSFEHLSASDQKSSYAFSAYDLKASRPSTGTILVFAKTLVNENSVYSTATGKFTAPIDGIYVFHATLFQDYPKKYIWVDFSAGGKAIGKFLVGDDYHDASSSGSAIAQLQKGTEVFLKVTSVHSGSGFREDAHGMSLFSGHLLSS